MFARSSLNPILLSVLFLSLRIVSASLFSRMNTNNNEDNENGLSKWKNDQRAPQENENGIFLRGTPDRRREQEQNSITRESPEQKLTKSQMFASLPPLSTYLPPSASTSPVVAGGTAATTTTSNEQVPVSISTVPPTSPANADTTSTSNSNNGAPTEKPIVYTFGENNNFYVYDLLPFYMNVYGRTSFGDLGLSNFLIKEMKKYFENVEEVLVLMSDGQKSNDTSDVYFQGIARFRLYPIDDKSVAGMIAPIEDVHQRQIEILSNITAINDYWSKTPSVGSLSVVGVRFYQPIIKDVIENENGQEQLIPIEEEKEGLTTQQPPTWVLASVGVILFLTLIIAFVKPPKKVPVDVKQAATDGGKAQMLLRNRQESLRRESLRSGGMPRRASMRPM